MKKFMVKILLLFLFLLLLCFPEDVKRGAFDGLSLWYHSVLPILLPFLIVSNLVMANDCFSLLLSPLKAINKKHTANWIPLIYPAFFGFFCGFPMGAKLIGDLVRSKALTKKQGDLFLPFVNQASPMFLAGYVGVHILKNSLSFWEILYYLYFPALFLLLLRILVFSFLSSASSHNFGITNQKETERSCLKNKNSMSLNMEHTIWNAFHIIVTIGIYMMLFTTVSKLCTKLLPHNRLLSLLLCCLEFSSGLDRLAGLPFLNQVTKTGLVLALTSFGGLCTAAQTSSLVKDTNISMKSYLLWKILTAVIVFFFYSSSSS